MTRGVPDDFAQRKLRPSLIAVVARQVKAARPVIDVRDPQAFATGIGIREAAGEESPCRCQTV